MNDKLPPSTRAYIEHGSQAGLALSVSAYLLRCKRTKEQAERDVEASRERHKGLTVISLEDERRLREWERVMEGGE